MLRSVAALIRSALGLDATAPCEPDPLDPYPLAKGNVWKYVLTLDGRQSYAYFKVVGNKTRGIRRAITIDLRAGFGGWLEHLSSDAAGVYIHGFRHIQYSPPRTVLKYPLTSGDHWAERYEANAVDEVASATVGEPEEVVVPAGTFRAVPVTTTIESGGARTDATTWYAAGVGVVKMVTRTGTQAMTLELLTFTPAGRN